MLRLRNAMASSAKGLLIAAAYVVFLDALAIRRNSVGVWPFVERMVLWAAIALVTMATVASMIRHRRFEPLGQDAAFREIGRWFHAILKH
jgi:hypothetical protein